MREIIFRGKRVDNGDWVEGSLVNNVFFHVDTKGAIPYIINPYEYEEYDCMEDIGELAVEVAPETVGQYTGLKDRNGKMIFEGDVVHVDNYDEGWDSTVVFKGGAFAIDVEGKDYDYTAIGWVEYEMEIIANIHEGEQTK
jgi:uncharacterized phage protein (TIGR01671 family)